MKLVRTNAPDIDITSTTAGDGGLRVNVAGSTVADFLRNEIHLHEQLRVSGSADIGGAVDITGSFRSNRSDHRALFGAGSSGNGAWIGVDSSMSGTFSTLARFREDGIQLLRDILNTIRFRNNVNVDGRLTARGGASVALIHRGNYTGTATQGSSSTQQIVSLPFDPVYVEIIHRPSGRRYYSPFYTGGSRLGHFWREDNDNTIAQGTMMRSPNHAQRPELVSGGFVVSGYNVNALSVAGLNRSGERYDFVAWGIG